MCLGVPAKVISVEGKMAKAEVLGSIIDVAVDFIRDLKPGEYLLVHAGAAIAKISKEEAELTLNVLEELNEIMGVS